MPSTRRSPTTSCAAASRLLTCAICAKQAAAKPSTGSMYGRLPRSDADWMLTDLMIRQVSREAQNKLRTGVSGGEAEDQGRPARSSPVRPSASVSFPVFTMPKEHDQVSDDDGCGRPFGQDFQQIGADHDGTTGHPRPGEVVGAPLVLGAPTDRPEGVHRGTGGCNTSGSEGAMGTFAALMSSRRARARTVSRGPWASAPSASWQCSKTARLAGPCSLRRHSSQVSVAGSDACCSAGATAGAAVSGRNVHCLGLGACGRENESGTPL